MSVQSHSVSFSIDNKTNKDFVLLETEPWEPYKGFLTKAGVVGLFNKILFEDKEVEPNCNSNGLFYTNKLYAYPSRPDLVYNIGWVSATGGERIIKTLVFTEAVQCNFELEINLKYPVISIESANWLGGSYGSEGEFVTNPEITISETGITLSKKVYGTLIVKYKVCQHTYSFSVNKRTGIENLFTAFAYAVWEGGNTYVELLPPSELEDGARCNTYGGSGNFTSDDPRPDSVPPEDEYIKIDYCTQEVVED